MRKLGNAFNAMERNVLILALAVMVIVTFTQVVMRYVFNNALSWSEEFARYLFIWFSWVGVSAGLNDKAHLKVEALSNALLKKGLIKTNGAVSLVVSLLWLATTLIVTYYGAILVAKQLTLGVVTPAMRMPVWIGYLSIPACGLVVGIRLIINIFGDLKVLFGKKGLEGEVRQ
jgi:TRAP-type C4-dicarboxylate transport system permease small subunit